MHQPAALTRFNRDCRVRRRPPAAAAGERRLASPATTATTADAGMTTASISFAASAASRANETR
jgi:hypothetical protein